MRSSRDLLAIRPPTRRRSRRRTAAALVGVALAAATVPVEPAAAATPTIAITARVSVGTGGGQASSPTIYSPLIDDTGRYVVFNSAHPFVAADTNAKVDVYRRDRLSGRTERLSLQGEADQISGLQSTACGMSPNGRWVAFETSDNAPSFQASEQLYLRDTLERTTTLISTGSNGPSNGPSGSTICSVSGDGTRVAFESEATNLGGGGAGVGDVFLRRVDAGTTELVSESSAGTDGNGDSGAPAISASGDVVGFTSSATNLVSADTNGQRDVFVHVVSTGTTQRVSVDVSGGQLEGESQSPSLSSTGRYVGFISTAPDAVVGDTNGVVDVFRKDRQTGTVERGSVETGADPEEGNDASSGATLSADGRFLAFTSDATNLYPADLNGTTDTFRHDFDLARTDLVSRVWNGISAGNAESWYAPALSGDGRVVAYVSLATNLVPGDTNGQRDVFVRDFALDIAPFDSAKAFATQQLVDFGPPNAFPAPPTVDDATKQIQQGAASPDGSIVAKARSASWTGKRSPLIRLYWAFFLRAPDLGGLTYWTNQLTNGKTLAQVAAKFALSSEFKNTYGSKSNAEFVTLIYQNIFERDPDPGGLAYWTGKLDAKAKTRGDVMVNFSESSEGKRFLAPQVDTINIWFGMLRTVPPPATLTSWIAAIRDGAATELVAQSIRAMPAYAARITP